MAFKFDTIPAKDLEVYTPNGITTVVGARSVDNFTGRKGPPDLVSGDFQTRTPPMVWK